jgi:hypothetical protein
LKAEVFGSGVEPRFEFFLRFGSVRLRALQMCNVVPDAGTPHGHGDLNDLDSSTKSNFPGLKPYQLHPPKV